MQGAPSKPRDPPEPIQKPDYPIHKLFSDYFEVRGLQYLVVVDLYSSWPMVYQATDLSVGDLVRALWQVFTIYGVAEYLTLDRATVFTGYVFKKVCKMWGVMF